MSMTPNRFTKALLAPAQYSTSAVALAAVTSRRSDKWYPRQDVAVFFRKTYTDTNTVDLDVEITPDSSSQIWYVSDSFTTSAGQSNQCLVPSELAYELRVNPTIGAGAENQADPYFGSQVSFPLIGYTS